MTSWGDIGGFKEDPKAMIFSVNEKLKFPCLKSKQAIVHAVNSGPHFGEEELAICSSPMNGPSAGKAKKSSENSVYKAFADSEGASLLTGEGSADDHSFTCIECEVYLVAL